MSASRGVKAQRVERDSRSWMGGENQRWETAARGGKFGEIRENLAGILREVDKFPEKGLSPFFFRGESLDSPLKCATI